MLLWCLYSCVRPWSVCEVVLVPYVDAVTVMHVLLFVFHMCMLREGDGNAGVGDGGDVVVVSAGHVGGMRGLGIVTSVYDVLRMSAVRGIRGVRGVCEICMGFAGDRTSWSGGRIMA